MKERNGSEADQLMRHTAVFNFANWFEVIAGLTLLAIALGSLMREFRHRSREILLRPA